MDQATLRYFGIDGDASRITWAHAVNSKQLLDDALSGTPLMLEADIVLDKTGVPIMAHPPCDTSDLTLEEFLSHIKDTSKGIKLDFKSNASVEKGLKVLRTKENEIKNPIWINADVISWHPDVAPNVNGNKFISLAKELNCSYLLSVGWTFQHPQDSYENSYSWTMVKDMNELLKQHAPSVAVSFPVEPSRAMACIEQLTWLMGETSHSSLTLFYSSDTKVSVEELVYLSTTFGKERVFMDLPPAVVKQLHAL